MNINPNYPQLKVTALLDTYSRICTQYECRLSHLDIENWMECLLHEKPDFVLVESVWGENYKKLMSLCNAKNEGRENIFDWCENRGIPTVFWTKEDPVFTFKIFIEAAKCFNYVFTTDSASVTKFQQECAHSRVHVLLHAAQSTLHNPIGRMKSKRGKVAFAGTWYAGYRKQRQKDLQILFDAALKYDLHIYDRNYNLNCNKYKYPHKYSNHVREGVSYENMADVYKNYAALGKTVYSSDRFNYIKYFTYSSRGLIKKFSDFFGTPDYTSEIAVDSATT